MKKLLALVLCVVMVLSMAPAAFAADDLVTHPYQPAPAPANPTDEWPSLYASNKAISNAKENIEYLYNGLAADNAVFSGIKAMDSFVVDLAKGLFKDVDDFTYYTKVWDSVNKEYVNKKITVSNDTLVKNTKAELRDIIGDSISDYMNDHIASYAEISTHVEIDGIELGRLTDTGLTTKAGNPLFTVGKVIYVYSIKHDQWSRYEGNKTLEELTEDVDRRNWKEVEEETVYDYRYDPIKYANAFSTAMSKALTSEKGAKGLEAYVYGLMQAKVSKEISDKFDDFWDAVEEWEDGTAILAAYGWNENSLDPYAFIDAFNVPKASMDLSDIAKPDATSFSWTNVNGAWVAD